MSNQIRCSIYKKTKNSLYQLNRSKYCPIILYFTSQDLIINSFLDFYGDKEDEDEIEQENTSKENILETGTYVRYFA